MGAWSGAGGLGRPVERVSRAAGSVRRGLGRTGSIPPRVGRVLDRAGAVIQNLTVMLWVFPFLGGLTEGEGTACEHWRNLLGTGVDSLYQIRLRKVFHQSSCFLCIAIEGTVTFLCGQIINSLINEVETPLEIFISPIKDFIHNPLWDRGGPRVTRAKNLLLG